MSNIVDFQDDNFLIKYLPTLKLRYLYYYNADFVMNILMEATKLIQQILKTFKLNMCCDCWKLRGGLSLHLLNDHIIQF